MATANGTGPARAERLAAAAAFVLSIAALVTGPLFGSEGTTDRPLVGLGCAVVASVLLMAGGGMLRLVVVPIAALDVLTLAVTSSPWALRPILAVALFGLVRQSEGRLVLWFAACVAVTAAGLGALVGEDENVWLEWSTDTAVLLLPVAAADARRSNLRRRTEAVERQVADQLQAERLRIAHDLHDIVAHSLSAITVQSGIAAHLFEPDPEAARRALVEINDMGRRSLDELRSLLGLLRADESVPLRPVPADPTGLADVVDVAVRGGFPVGITEDGAYPDDVAESTVVTVHRIVHECLVNVARHAGSVRTTVDLVHGADGVHVEVANDAPREVRTAAPSTGIGLVAMRERAEMLGGSVEAGPTHDGGFLVEAFVPYHPARRHDP